MAALLFPISLHTQVEHPFYISAYHWVIFLFLLFITFQSGCKPYALRISSAAVWMIKGMMLLMLLIVFWFAGTALYYSHRIVYVLYSGEAKLSELNAISQHPFFTNKTISYWLESRSNTEKATHGITSTMEYAKWMETSLQNDPDINVFLKLIKAYAYLGDSVRMQATIDRALYLYRDQPLILKAAKEASGE